MHDENRAGATAPAGSHSAATRSTPSRQEWKCLSPADRETIEQKLLGLTARELQSFGPFAGGKNNHQTWFNAAMVALNEHFATTTLRGFGFETYDVSLSAAGAIIQYLRETQKTALS